MLSKLLKQNQSDQGHIILRGAFLIIHQSWEAIKNQRPGSGEQLLRPYAM
uniref:Uncharacterized protein n=1 Tax=Arion vulgaris TaxID=1028688 RepID=A0A0B6ZFH2_9EUPU